MGRRSDNPGILGRCPECGSTGVKNSICTHPEPIGAFYRLPGYPAKPYDWENEPSVEHWQESLSEPKLPVDEHGDIHFICSCFRDNEFPCDLCVEDLIEEAETITRNAAKEAP